MLSALGNPDLPPMMAPEAQDPSLFGQWQANANENANSPKGKVAMALLQQQLGKMGTMFNPGLMPHQPSPLYGVPQ